MEDGDRVLGRRVRGERAGVDVGQQLVRLIDQRDRPDHQPHRPDRGAVGSADDVHPALYPRQRRDQDVRTLHGRKLLHAVGRKLPPTASLPQTTFPVIGGMAGPGTHREADPPGGHARLDQALSDLPGAVIRRRGQQHPRTLAGARIGGELGQFLFEAASPQQPAHQAQRHLPVTSTPAGDPHQALIGGADRRRQDTNALRVLIPDPPGRLDVQVMVRRAGQVRRGRQAEHDPARTRMAEGSGVAQRRGVHVRIPAEGGDPQPGVVWPGWVEELGEGKQQPPQRPVRGDTPAAVGAERVSDLLGALHPGGGELRRVVDEPQQPVAQALQMSAAEQPVDHPSPFLVGHRPAQQMIQLCPAGLQHPGTATQLGYRMQHPSQRREDRRLPIQGRAFVREQGAKPTHQLRGELGALGKLEQPRGQPAIPAARH